MWEPDDDQWTVLLAEAISAKLGEPYSLTVLSRNDRTRTLQLLEGIARRLGLLPPLPVLPPSVPTITKSIGTSSRDYSTITSWEADLDNAAVYASGDTALGECYNDSVFDESVNINGGGTVGLAAVTLSVAAGQRHDGTAGSGARIVRTASTSSILTLTGTSTRIVTLEWLEVTSTASGSGFNLTPIILSGTDTKNVVQRCIIHNVYRGTGSANVPSAISVTNVGGCSLLDNFIYNISASVSVTASGLVITGIGSQTPDSVDIHNNTLHDFSLDHASSTADITAYSTPDVTNRRIQNNIATGGANAGSGAAICFATWATATDDHNASSDATAAGTGSLTNIVAADQFVSVTGGSEDLHLKSGADCIDAGTDLVTTPAGVNIDIDGRDRDAEADTWDIGADEFVSVAAGNRRRRQLICGGLTP